MTKVDLETRLKVLHEIDELLTNQCQDCQFNTYQDGRDNEAYCRTQCPYGLKLQELGKQYCGFTFRESQKGKYKKDMDKDEAIQMYHDGIMLKDIAKHFSLSSITVSQRLKQWGVQESEFKKNENNQILDWYKNGWNKSKIARKLGLNPSTVTKRLKKLGVN